MDSFRKFVRQHGDRPPVAVLPEGLNAGSPEAQFATSLYESYRRSYIGHLPGMLLQLAATALFSLAAWHAGRVGARGEALITGVMAAVSFGFALACTLRASSRIRCALRVYQRYLYLMYVRRCSQAAMAASPGQ